MRTEVVRHSNMAELYVSRHLKDVELEFTRSGYYNQILVSYKGAFAFRNFEALSVTR